MFSVIRRRMNTVLPEPDGPVIIMDAGCKNGIGIINEMITIKIKEII